MLALLCALLLVACASDASLSTEEQIHDMHAKVTEIWQAVTGGKAADRGQDPTLHAICQVQPSASLDAEQLRVTGLVLFRQRAPGAQLEIIFHLEGFPPEANGTKRAIHVHQFGDMSQGCESTGPHYNPLEVPHPQHVGDFGNFVVRDGSLWKYRSSFVTSLSGPHSIVGRGLVVHEGEDDLGLGGNKASLASGNSGARLACCVVGLCGPEPWARMAQERRKRRRDTECKTD